MSDQAHTAPHAPQPSVAAPATASAPGPSMQETHHASHPVHATPAQSATADGATPAIAPSATTIPPPASQDVAATAQPTLNETLNSRDRYWKFKTVLQIVTIIVGIIGIGAVAWSVQTASTNNYYFYSYELVATWPSLITFAISIIWCLTCILVLVVKKRPIHPGLRVAMDLLLWLGFLVTGLFAVVVLVYVMDWGTNGDFGFSSSYGDYELQPNGTWVWENSSSSSTYSSRSRDCARSSSSYNYYGFSNCAEQDAYINDLWQKKPHRVSIILMGVVCNFIVLLLHFVLFVWACVDEHRRRHSRVSQDAEKLAANIVQTMIQNGAIIPPPSQAHMKPIPYGQPGNYHLAPGQMYPMAYPQGHVMQYNQQQPQQGSPGHPLAQQHAGPQMAEQRPDLPPRPVVAGPSNEKSQGPRYA